MTNPMPPQLNPKSHRSAFSLVELSIVLVILGLLTGGILTGQNLIRAAELRSVTTEFREYQSAIMTFRDKYFALPGDMKNATDFWGAMTNCAAASPSGTGTQTCNGDGDGQIFKAAAASQTGEMFGIWQQLANAGLIEGSYTGIAGSGGAGHALVGENIPISKFNQGGWLAYYFGTSTGWFSSVKSNKLIIGGQHATGWSVTPIFSPEEIWNIDQKMDDGKPGSGKVMAPDPASSTAPNCATSTDAATASYSLTLQTTECFGFFFLD